MNPGQKQQFELMMKYSPSTAYRYAQFVSREGYFKEATDKTLSPRQRSKKKQEEPQ